MPVGIGKIGVGGHDSLLDREYEVVGCVKRGGGDWRVAPAQSQLQRLDRFAQAWRRLRLVLKAECLDVVEQDV